jgi:hypothetical protein
MRVELDGLVESQRQLNIELAGSARLGRQFGSALGTAFVGLTLQGKSFGDVLRSLALSLSRMLLNAAFRPLQSAFGNAFQSMMSAPSPFTASGSVAAPSSFPVSAGSPVGNSPAGASGAFPVPASSGGSATAFPFGGAVVFNVTTPDAESFRRSETQIAGMFARVVGRGQRNL